MENLDIIELDDKDSIEEESDVVVQGYTGERTTSVLKAIKKHCLDCCCFQRDEVKYCPCTSCNLWPFRLGKNPYRKKRELTEEQKLAVKERMSKYWDRNK